MEVREGVEAEEHLEAVEDSQPEVAHKSSRLALLQLRELRILRKVLYLQPLPICEYYLIRVRRILLSPASWLKGRT